VPNTEAGEHHAKTLSNIYLDHRSSHMSAARTCARRSTDDDDRIDSVLSADTRCGTHIDDDDSAATAIESVE
jgi:hypothetical protein